MLKARMLYPLFWSVLALSPILYFLWLVGSPPTVIFRIVVVFTISIVILTLFLRLRKALKDSTTLLRSGIVDLLLLITIVFAIAFLSFSISYLIVYGALPIGYEYHTFIFFLIVALIVSLTLRMEEKPRINDVLSYPYPPSIRELLDKLRGRYRELYLSYGDRVLVNEVLRRVKGGLTREQAVLELAREHRIKLKQA